MAYQQSRLRAGDHVGARALLGRSIQSLSRHKHVEVSGVQVDGDDGDDDDDGDGLALA